MHERFLSLDPDKQQRIINAALSEFAAKGYRQAATDDIVAKAGISKGALFHYFGSKERLYLFVLDWVVRTIQEEVSTKIDWVEPDFFKRILQASKLKLQALVAYPELWRFYETFSTERPDIARDWIDGKTAQAAPSTTQRYLKDIDTSRFRDGIDLEKMANVVRWALHGFSEATLANARVRHEALDLRRVFAEADAYVEFLKTLFYKDGAP